METLTAASPALDAAACWRAVLERDASADGAFVYAVRSTGIFCRPSCPSRRPRRDQAAFFGLAEAAERAGYRACKRCRPKDAPLDDPRLNAIRRVCRAIAEADEAIPTLKDLGRVAGMSPHHLQRLFTHLIGVSPRQYGEALRLGRLKKALKEGEPLAQAIYGAGYGSASRLYEKAGPHLGMTPATYARGGRDARIAYTVAASPLGRLLVAATPAGVCLVALGEDDATLERELRADYPLAEVRREDGALKDALAAILAHVDGTTPHVDLPLDVRATAFQWRVWQALAAIPPGEVRSYGEIAGSIGQPGAARAVGRACATNPVALVIPCHRAVGGKGALTGYRWGVERKEKLLAREKTRG